MRAPRFSAATVAAAVCLSVPWATFAQVASSATPPPAHRYVVSFGNMTVWNGVAHGKDTDYLSYTVLGPGGQKFVQAAGPIEVGKHDVYIWKIGSKPIAVPDDSGAMLSVSWAAVNSGHKKRDDVLKGLMNVSGDIGIHIDDPIIQIPAALIKAGAKLISQNCDAPLFGGGLTLDGASLAGNLNGKDGWHSEGPARWHKVFDYPNIKSDCDTGHYNLEIHIQRL